ncbi:MAG: EAL domain-containing protein [Clostridia bacterium]|nr:EAL domain-containing protein [Clostridia bacterium]
MNQDVLFSQYLEDLTDAITDLDNFDIAKTYDILREMCVAFRVCKGVTEYYSSEEAERKGDGVVLTCYDSGEEAAEVMTCRTVLSDVMVADCKAFRAKNSDPWSEKERKRIEMIQRLILNVLGRLRATGMVEQATLFDDAGYSNNRFLVATVDQIGNSGLIGQYALARFNLRHFSLINRQLGRDICDQVLRRYIDKVEETISPDGIVSRLGGDNFVAVFKKEKLNQVLPYFEGVQIPFNGDEEGRVLISSRAGIFVVPDNYYFLHSGDVMDRITSAYNAAWRGESGDIVFASDQMMEEKEKFMRTRALFPISLKNHDFLVYYQPKIDLRTSCLTGAEALSRWYRNGSLIMPADYIPDLEQTMDICRLDFYVLDQVCQDLRRWLDQGRQAVRVSVNFSRRHLINPDLLSQILEVIDRYQVPHEYIEIELTETITDVEFRDLKRVTRGLQEAGIYTSVDDFGIGYSSLNLIREIPWNILKVDKNFLPVSENSDKDKQNIMFRHVVSMAKEIGLICVAEGVETQEQVNILRKCGCDIAQGFFYDKPLPVREFENRLDTRKYTNSQVS